MRVVFTKAAVRDLRKIPVHDRDKLLSKIRTYAETGQGDVVAMKSLRDTYRIRSGNYRAIFEIQNDLLVIHAGHRKSVYR